MGLKINISEVKSKPVLNLAKSLQKKFRPGSQNDISDAVVLSCYLYILGKVEASIELLYSFLYFNYKDKPESQRHLWVDNCEGLLLLAYIQDREGLKKISIDLNYIMGEESIVDPVEFMKDQLKYYIEDNSKVQILAENESPKYMCLLYAQQVLRFISVIVLWPHFSHNGRVKYLFNTVELKNVEELLEANINSLRRALEKYS
jgi:hypothetical protein